MADINELVAEAHKDTDRVLMAATDGEGPIHELLDAVEDIRLWERMRRERGEIVDEKAHELLSEFTMRAQRAWHLWSVFEAEVGELALIAQDVHRHFDPHAWWIHEQAHREELHRRRRPA